MKTTYAGIESGPCVLPGRRGATHGAALRSGSRLALVCAFVAVIAMIASPVTVKASGPNGTYGYTGGGGVIVVAGQRIPISGTDLASLVNLGAAGITVSKNRLAINKSGLSDVLVGFPGTVKIKGDKSLLLRKAGKGYKGEADIQLIVNTQAGTGGFAAAKITADIKLKMKVVGTRAKLSPKVEGVIKLGKQTLNFTAKGRILGSLAS